MGKREGGMGEEGTGMRGEGWDRQERREGGIGTGDREVWRGGVTRGMLRVKGDTEEGMVGPVVYRYCIYSVKLLQLAVNGHGVGYDWASHKCPGRVL